MRRSSYLAAILASMSWAAAAAASVNGNGPPALDPAAGVNGDAASSLDPAAAAHFAGLALKCLHAEYPNHISHTLDGDADARPPHALNPAFYGCYDWHSDVHGHWLLVRLLRLIPDAPFAPLARTELARSFTADNVAAEIPYLHRADPPSFQRPYSPPCLL